MAQKQGFVWLIGDTAQFYLVTGAEQRLRSALLAFERHLTTGLAVTVSEEERAVCREVASACAMGGPSEGDRYIGTRKRRGKRRGKRTGAA